MFEEFQLTTTKLGDDQLWIVTQPIQDNIEKLIQDPEMWIRKQNGKEDVIIPSRFSIHIRTKDTEVFDDLMMVQGIGGTDIINVYLPESITATVAIPPPPAGTTPGVHLSPEEVVYVFESDAVETTPATPGDGKLFVHYPLFNPEQPPSNDTAVRRAATIAAHYVEIAKNPAKLKDIAEPIVLDKSKRKILYRKGTVLLELTDPVKKDLVPIPPRKVIPNPRIAILSEKSGYREACEILVARYLAGEISYEEAYIKAYAGP